MERLEQGPKLKNRTAKSVERLQIQISIYFLLSTVLNTIPQVFWW